MDGPGIAARSGNSSESSGAGAQLCYHGDLDWPGVRIGNHVMREHGAQSWRFDASDYEAAAEGASNMRQILVGKAVPAIWDDGLMTAIQRHGLSIAEEALAASLLKDLRVCPERLCRIA
jgi:uncharacterized protein (TIGR02679 family)